MKTIDNSSYFPIKEVKFYIKSYKIHFVERLLSSDDKDRLYGSIDYTNGIINLDPNHALDAMKLTFLHEVSHAILSLFLIKDLSEEDNEKVVDAMANGFMLFVKQNPEIIKFLLEENQGDSDE